MASANEPKGIDVVTAYLDENGVRYELVTHEQTFAATEEARAAGVPPANATKTLVLRGAAGYRLAVIPASERLDVHKVRSVLDESTRLRLATEQEIAEDFGQFEVGAVPPLGPMVAAPEVLDRRLLEHERVLCTGGDHRHSIKVDPKEIVRVASARVADICEE